MDYNQQKVVVVVQASLPGLRVKRENVLVLEYISEA